MKAAGGGKTRASESKKSTIRAASGSDAITWTQQQLRRLVGQELRRRRDLLRLSGDDVRRLITERGGPELTMSRVTLSEHERRGPSLGTKRGTKTTAALDLLFEVLDEGLEREGASVTKLADVMREFRALHELSEKLHTVGRQQPSSRSERDDARVAIYLVAVLSWSTWGFGDVALVSDRQSPPIDPGRGIATDDRTSGTRLLRDGRDDKESEVVRAAISLLESTTSIDPSTVLDPSVIISARQLSRVSLLPDAVRHDWARALEGLLVRGWNIRHCVSRDRVLRRPTPIEQAEFVAALLTTAKYPGVYEPILDLPPEVPDLVSVPNVGAMILIGGPSPADLDAGEHVHGLSAIRFDAAHDRGVSQELHQRLNSWVPSEGPPTRLVSRFPLPMGTMPPTLAFMTFDAQLTAAESTLGERDMFKAGIATSTMPPAQTLLQFDRWKNWKDPNGQFRVMSSDQRAMIDVLRLQRDARFEALHHQAGQVDYRDICPRESLEAYLRPDEEQTPSSVAYGHELSELSERVVHVRHLVTMLRDPNLRYDLRLPSRVHLRALSKLWFSITRSGRADRDRVHLVLHPTTVGPDAILPDTPLVGTIAPSSMETWGAVRSFGALFDTYWAYIQSTETDLDSRDKVAQYLEALADQAT